MNIYRTCFYTVGPRTPHVFVVASRVPSRLRRSSRRVSLSRVLVSPTARSSPLRAQLCLGLAHSSGRVGRERAQDARRRGGDGALDLLRAEHVRPAHPSHPAARGPFRRAGLSTHMSEGGRQKSCLVDWRHGPQRAFPHNDKYLPPRDTNKARARHDSTDLRTHHTTSPSVLLTARPGRPTACPTCSRATWRR